MRGCGSASAEALGPKIQSLNERLVVGTFLDFDSRGLSGKALKMHWLQQTSILLILVP